MSNESVLLTKLLSTLWVGSKYIIQTNPSNVQIKPHTLYGEGHFRFYNPNLTSIIFSCGPHCTDSLCGSWHANFYKLVCLVICCKPYQIIMTTSVIDLNIKYATVYYNGKKKPICLGFILMVWCLIALVEGSVGSNQLLTQSHRHKEGGRCWVSTSSIDRLS